MMKIIKNQENWVRGEGRDTLPDPLVILSPQFLHRQEGGDAMEVHNFADKNKALLDKGAKYLLDHSGKATRASYGKPPAVYIEQELVPVLESIKEKVQGGDWDYVGKSEEARAKREADKQKLLVYINTLIGGYTVSPGDLAADELVMMYGLLEKQPVKKGEGSPFVCMFENLLESFDAYPGDSASCKAGIKERIFRDVGLIERTSNAEQAVPLTNAFDAMQVYIDEYMSAFVIDGELSPLFCDIATFYIAQHISKSINPSEVSIEDAYSVVDPMIKKSLLGYVSAQSMPWVCGVFSKSMDKALKDQIAKKLSEDGGFFEGRANEIESGDYDPKADFDFAKDGLLLNLRKAAITRCLMNAPPDGFNNWDAFNADENRVEGFRAQLRPTQAENEHSYNISAITERANKILESCKDLFPDIKFATD